MTEVFASTRGHSNNRILIVEDDEIMRLSMMEYLQAHGFDILAAGSAEEALELVRGNVIDVLLVDWVLPRRSGVDLCTQVRKDGFTGAIVVITGKGELEHQITGHASGADHYWVKPMPLKLLKAKLDAIVRSLARRVENSGNFPVADGTFDEARSRLARGARSIELSGKHAGILKSLLLAKGGWVSRGELLARVWRYKSLPTTRTVDNYIVELRKILLELFGTLVEIRSKRGVGYCLIHSAASPN